MMTNLKSEQSFRTGASGKLVDLACKTTAEVSVSAVISASAAGM